MPFLYDEPLSPSDVHTTMDGDPSDDSSGQIQFNWLFLVESATIAIVVIFYLFYFNRVLGWLIASACNLYLRRCNYRASVEFEAIQLSLLAGRILFRNARYHSINQSLRIVKGHLTCRYWYLRTQGVGSYDSGYRETDSNEPSTLPYRWIIAFEGAEWFVYNRTAAFDAVLEHLGLVNPHDPSLQTSQKQAHDDSSDRQLPSGASQTTFKIQQAPSINTNNHRSSSDQPGDGKESMMSWALRDALPLRIEGNVGVITVGNPSTSSILVFTFKKTHGVYSALSARSRHDFFRQDFKFSFFEPKIVLRTNPDFSQTLKDQGAVILKDLQSDPSFEQSFCQPIQTLLTSASFAQFGKYFSKKLTGIFRRAHPLRQAGIKTSRPILEEDFLGLPRFVRAKEPIHPVEYAKVTTILTASIMNFRYYLDSPGKVPADPLMIHQLSASLSVDPEDALPPEYGIDVKLVDANITYGPWADRQRSIIQQIIFPPQRFDNVEVPQPFSPGDQRAHTELLVKVDLDNCQIRVPIREFSKDWQWFPDVTNVRNETSSIRPYGWLDLFLGSGSEITLTQSQIAQKEGYETVMQLRIMDLEARSSVNDKIFAKIPMVLIVADMPAPLVWDSHRTWKYCLTLCEQSQMSYNAPDSRNQPRVSLVRDHIQFLTDLIKDWVSGPPTPYEEWIPTTYQIELNLVEYELCLHLNDLNIIESFDLEIGSGKNTLLLLSGHSLKIHAEIPGDCFRPPISTIPFGVQFKNLDVKIDYPHWSTQHSFASTSAVNCAELDRVVVEGRYDMSDLVKPEAVDFLVLNLEMKDILFKAFGHLFRLMMNIKDNYLGSFHHFSTQEEFIKAFKKGFVGDPPEETKFRHLSSNAFEMDLNVTIKNLLLAFPQDPFDCQDVVFCSVPDAHCFLKNHSSFMDMNLKASPLRFQPATDWEQLIDDRKVRQQALSGDFNSFPSQTRVRLESLRLTLLMFFGPSPAAVTYFSDWRCSLGKLTGELAIADIDALARFVSVIGEGFVDKANSLLFALPLPSEPDVTFARMTMATIDLIVIAPRSRARLHLPSGLQLSFNDFASDLFKNHAAIVVPTCGVYLLVPDPRGNLHNPAIPWLEVASCTGNLEVLFYAAALGWEQKAQTQRKFLEEQDFQTQRCHFLYGERVKRMNSHLPSAAEDILEDLERSQMHDPHAVIDASDDENSLRSHVGRLEGSESSAEQSDTDGRIAEKNLRRARLLYQRRLSVSASRILPANTPPIPATPYATALPSWRYYGFNPDQTLQQPTFSAMRAGLFPPESFSNKQRDSESMPTYSPRMLLRSYSPPKHVQVLGRKYFDLRMKTPVDVFLTPLCVEVLDDMLESLANEESEEISRSHVRLLGLLTPKPSPNITSTAGHSVSEFFISVPLIRFRLLQDIVSAFQPTGSSHIPSTLPALSAMTLLVKQVCMKGESGLLLSQGPWDELGVPQSVQATIERIQFLLREDPRVVINKSFVDLPSYPDGSADAVLSLESDAIELQLSHSGHQLESSVNMLDSSCSFVERAAEALAGSLVSLIRHYGQAMNSVSKFKYRRLDRLRQAIYRLIESDNETTPSCLRRSPFWSRMAIFSQRSSFSWYCLVRLRHIAHSLTNHRTFTPSEPRFLEAAVRHKLNAWNLDHGGDSDVGSLNPLLPRISPPLEPSSKTSLQSCLMGNHSFVLRTGCFVGRYLHNADSPRLKSPADNLNQFLQLPPITLLAATKLTEERVVLGIYINTGRITCAIDPQLSSLVQHVIGLVHSVNPPSPDEPWSQQDFGYQNVSPLPRLNDSPVLSMFSNLELSVVFGGAKFQAAVHRLGTSIEFGKLAINFRRVTALGSLSQTFFLSVSLESVGACFSEICQEDMSSALEPVFENSLMSGFIQNIASNAFVRPDPSQHTSELKLLMSVGSIHAAVGRSLVKMEEFVRNWRRGELASRVVPTYHKIMEAWKSRPVTQVSSGAAWRWSLCLEFYLAEIKANFQPIPRLEVIYNLQGLRLTNFKASLKNQELSFNSGLAVDQHTLSFTSSTEQIFSQPSDSTPHHRGFLRLPALHVLFSYESCPRPSMQLDLLIDFFSAYLSIDWLDTILTMIARYGEDINELIHLFQPPIPAEAETSPIVISTPDDTSLNLFAEILLSGFEFSISAPKPLPRIECRRVKGTIHPKLRYLQLKECAISLAPHEQSVSKRQSIARFVFDLLLSNQSPTWAFSPNSGPDVPRKDSIEIAADFQRIHAVAATSAFKLLLDCIQYLQIELARIKTVRRTEMTEAESHIEQAWCHAQHQYISDEPILQRLIFAGRCSQFGLAIPLDDDPPVTSDSLRITSPNQDSRRAALLISFSQFVTWSRLGQAAHASVDLFALQSVSELDPSDLEHFESSSHESRNGVFVPHLDIRFGLTARRQAPTLLTVKASAPSGITIDLSPSILLILYAFLDVYERDYDLILNLIENQAPIVDLEETPQTQAAIFGSNIALSPTITDPWAIRVDFDTGDGDGGKIQLHTFDLAQDDNDFVEILQRANVSLGRFDVNVAHSDSFFLPGVSAWAMYNPISSTSDAALHIDILVHSSQNTVNPTLLRFVSQMSAAVNQRVSSKANPPNRIHPTRPSAEPTKTTKSSILSTNISVGLRIDRSELTITCVPTRALAKLQWASGVLFASGRLDENRFNAAFTVSKITALLRHEHGFDSALKAEADDMVASFDWRATSPPTHCHTHTCSVLLKFSQLLTEVDFNHLHICLLFKAIWLDQVTSAPSSPKHNDQSSQQVETPPKNDTTVLLVAILVDHIKFLLRLSPSIGTLHSQTTPLTLRVRHIPSVSRSLALDIGDTCLDAAGDGLLGGRGCLDYFTLLMSVEDLSSNTILDINATIGPIKAHLAVSSETILLLYTDIIRGSVQDDWKDIKFHNANPSHESSSGKDLGLKTSLHLKSVDVLATLYTASRGKSVLNAIENQVDQQNTQAEDVLSQLPPGMIVRREKDTLLDVAQRLENERSIKSNYHLIDEIKIIGSLQLTSQSISLALFAGQFGDMPLLRMHLLATRALLTRSPATALTKYCLDFTTEGCRVARLNLLPNGISEKAQSDGTWYAMLEKVPSESVLNANRLWINMLASEMHNKNQVTHTYRAVMPNNIHISTDVTTHANLWSKFRSAWNNANAVKGTSELFISETQEPEEVNGDLWLVAESPPVIEDAKVQELWHATLPLVNYFKWNENLPRYTFIRVIKPLDGVIDFFESVYQTAFARHRYKKPLEASKQ